jgi:F0F1-type ATP synthase membrane subunit c/vacuolar-type H+-ATPase subunit K
MFVAGLVALACLTNALARGAIFRASTGAVKEK